MRASVRLHEGEFALNPSLLSDSLTIESRLHGDMNGDGQVGFQDFLIFAQFFDRTSVSSDRGDLDRDGSIDLADFDILKANFGKSL